MELNPLSLMLMSTSQQIFPLIVSFQNIYFNINLSGFGLYYKFSLTSNYTFTSVLVKWLITMYIEYGLCGYYLYWY